MSASCRDDRRENLRVPTALRPKVEEADKLSLTNVSLGPHQLRGSMTNPYTQGVWKSLWSSPALPPESSEAAWLPSGWLKLRQALVLLAGAGLTLPGGLCRNREMWKSPNVAECHCLLRRTTASSFSRACLTPEVHASVSRAFAASCDPLQSYTAIQP